MNLWWQVRGALHRQAAKQADELRQTIKRSVDIAALVQAFELAFPVGSTASRSEVREWVQVNGQLRNLNSTAAALKMIYAIGYALGEQAGAAAIQQQRAKLSKAPTTFRDPSMPKPPKIEVDWSSWTAGNHPAALLVRPKGGLGNLLANAGIASRTIGKTTLNRIGTALADALTRGATDTSLARELFTMELLDKLGNIIDDPSRLLTIANTEMNRAMSTASMDTYRTFGVDQVEWLHDGCDCDLCNEAADMGPQPFGTDFGDGVTEPPMHPNCTCAMSPVIDFGEDEQFDD